MSLKEKRPETLVGVFVLVGLLALAALVVQFSRIGDRSGETYTVQIEFADASGLLKGSEVRMGGAKIGRVAKTPELNEELKVIVELDLDQRVKVYRDSEFLIQSVSFIGDTMIVVVPPEELRAEAVLQDGALVKGDGAGGLAAIQSDAESVARDANRLMKDARVSLLKFDAALDDVRVVSGRLSETLEKVNHGVLGDENLANLKESMANLEAATQSFQKVGAELEPAAGEVQALVLSVKDAAQEANKTFQVVRNEVESLEPALKELPVMLREFRKTAQKVNRFVDTADSNLSDGEGLLGTLVADKEVGTDTKTFIKNLKRHGILGYQDDSSTEESEPRSSRFRGLRR